MRQLLKDFQVLIGCIIISISIGFVGFCIRAVGHEVGNQINRASGNIQGGLAATSGIAGYMDSLETELDELLDVLRTAKD